MSDTAGSGRPERNTEASVAQSVQEHAGVEVAAREPDRARRTTAQTREGIRLDPWRPAGRCRPGA
ncbi:hypothetical protein [Kitasatospora sp. NPDC093679]|uniref:hypothetical protein n=1 Tax=Kitasatospora sp. NPDC093679 TaxID=3154983 RepID=UPI00342EB5BA